MNILGIGGKVSINGKTYKGGSISINNGDVTIDGNLVEGLEECKVISISVEGDVKSIDSQSGKVVVSGNVGTVSTGSGSVSCGSVGGNVKTGSGDVYCTEIGGSVKTGSGDVSGVANRS